MWRTNSLEKTLMLGKIEGGRRRDQCGWDSWMASPTRWTCIWASSGVGDGQGSLACCSPWGHKKSDITERLNWTERFFLQTDSPISCCINLIIFMPFWQNLTDNPYMIHSICNSHRSLYQWKLLSRSELLWQCQN